MESIRLKARAKINLGLDVLGKRDNGYHDVRMVMQTVGIYDRLIINKIPEDDIRIDINLKFLPVNENNLIYKAYKLMKDEYGFSGGIEVDLNKFIPIAAGMAGGSTDAASAMFAINKLFNLGLSNRELMEQGVKIGADVPYCIMRGTALAERMGNVLEDVTIPLYPVIDKIKKDMISQGAYNAMMSGSGPTVFGIFPDEQTALNCKEYLKRQGDARQVYITETFN